MAYSPELDEATSALVRRIAWAARVPMTLVLSDVVLHVAQCVDPEKVCPACRDDSRCSQCYLKVPPRPSGIRLTQLFREP